MKILTFSFIQSRIISTFSPNRVLHPCDQEHFIPHHCAYCLSLP